tara:strand:+ start:702579 stop:704462 length:1884 start_codon:yes stop_codon:yes gene_type:complete
MTWVIFWCSVAVAISALAWVSVEVVALEKRDAAAKINASRQESIRRALWRMDSRMAPILAIEASRPFTDYKSTEGTRAQWLQNAQQQDLPTASQAYDSVYSYANSYFEFPQTEEKDADQTPDPIATLINSNRSSIHSEKKESKETAERQSSDSSTPETGFVLGGDQGRSDSDSDYAARKMVADIAQHVQSVPIDTMYDDKRDIEKEEIRSERYVQGLPEELAIETQDVIADQAKGKGLGKAPPTTVTTGVETIGTLRPKWVTDDANALQLVLVRSAVIEGKPVTQGVWLDWDALKNDLLDSVHDVMPGSSLIAVTGPRSSMIGGYQLATIPVEFIPNTNAVVASFVWSPATLGLLVTWIAIITTIIAVGIVLRAAIVLSERRGRFVSAVTHELRTPLTTFRLYAQMLADGMVSDDQVRTEYLQTLKRESERLTGIVENVLEYARLTRQRPSKDKSSGVQTISPGALIARFRPLLARRASQSNMDLVVSFDLEAHQHRTLTVDPHAVERIMMNLIENACKYAGPSEQTDNSGIDEADTRIHLDVAVKGESLELLVADHGNGIDPGEESKIFGEFQRGWRGLANARSGLGLGLALSRGLAREMQGDLVLTNQRGHGAEFLLTLQLDKAE